MWKRKLSFTSKKDLFTVLSVEKENPNRDSVDFNRPQNMVIVCTGLPVSTNLQP